MIGRIASAMSAHSLGMLEDRTCFITAVLIASWWELIEDWNPGTDVAADGGVRTCVAYDVVDVDV